MEELYLFDKEENLLGIVPAEDLYAHEQEVELNKFIQIFLTKRYDVVTESAYYIGHKDIDDNQTFQLYRPTMIRTENGVMDIEGIHTFFDEMKSNGYIKDKRPTNASVYTALNAILEGSRWQIGNINSSALGTANFYYQSRLSAFWDFIEAWGVEFKIRMTFSNGKITGRYVDIYDRISKDNGKWFERGDKLVKTVMEEQRAEIYTALLGRGRGEEKFDENGQSTGGFGRKITFEDVEWKKENGDPVDKPLGQPFVELPEATAIYGFPGGQPRIGIVEMDNIEDPEILLSEVYEQLLIACRPKRELQAQALETGLTELGETVAIIDDETGIRYKTRVFKLRRNFLNKLDKTFTFGERLTSSRAEKSVQIQRQIKKQEERTETWMNGLLEAYTSIYFNADGYNYKLDAGNEFGLPGGFYSFNAPIDENPTKMIYMGAGMLAISNSKDAQGNWIMKTFGTGDGFTADLMTAGRLDAERVRITNGNTDVLWVDAGTGEVVMNISKMTINAIPVATKEDLDAIELTPGKSAYDIAKENGFVGTEAQWLESLQGQDGSNGTPGEKGADGKTSYLHIAYANSADGSAGFSTTVATGKAYIGQYTDFVEADSSDYKKYTWSKFKGENGYTPVKGTDYFDGVDGQDGSDGESSFLWIRYSQNPNGYPMTTNPTNAVYIGVATTQSSVAPTDYTKFQWALIKGENGTPGEPGTDGRTSYLHIRYSNDGGKTFTANNGETVGEWIGTYVDFVEADSTVVSKYTWNKVKGEPGEQGPQGLRGLQGPQGTQGIQGKPGADGVSSYTHIAYATSSTGANFSHETFESATYIGMYVDETETSSSVPSDYQWTLIKGADGSRGLQGPKGTDGQTPYFHTAWATSIDGSTGFSTTVSVNKTHIGTYTDFVEADSDDPTKYDWVQIKGDKGDTGPKGATGSQGPKGDTGTSVSSVTEYYLATGLNSGVTASTSGWTTSIQTMTATNKYLWNYEKINFSDGTSQPTVPVIIGVYGDKGQTGSTGATGRSITGITEHYLASNSATGVTRTTSGWTTSMQQTTPEKRYLWNYETITWSSGTSPTYVEPIVIGVHGEKGPQGEKGDTGPQGATGSQGPRGNAGTSVTGITEYYLATSASSGVTTSTSGWSTSIQTMTATNKYLWNYEKVNFSDGTNQPTVPVIIGVYGDKGQTGSTGATGRSITAITEHYLATDLATGVTRTTSGWTTTMQTTTETKRYLWNYETITWSSGTITTYVEPIIIGVHGLKGPKGDTGPQGATGEQGPRGNVGTSVTGITEHYLATSASSGVTVSTSGWTTSIQTMTATNKYLWNYERVNFSDGTNQPTIPVIIGVYGDKGQTGSTGATGRSITGITEHYLATDLATGVTRSTSGWTTTMQTTTETKRYLWNYETVTWSSGTTTTYVEPIIIGIHGLQGPKGDTGPKGATGSQGPKGDAGTSVSSVTEYYLATSASSGVTTSTTGWTTTIQTMTATNKYLWNYEKINFSDGTNQPTIPVIIGVYGDKGQTGGTGPTGRSITAIKEHYLATSLATGVTRSTSGWSTTMQTTTPTNKYLWNYETITWSSGTTTTYVEPIIIGIHGEQGPKGDTGPKGATGSQGPKGDAGTSVSSVTEYYLATASSTGVTTDTTGWSTSIQTMTATNKYLWNYEKINFSDGTNQPTIPVIIGVYGDKGQTGSTGATGRSITAIQEYYLATSLATGVTRTTSGWSTTMQTTTPTNKYLWNYEKVTWSSGTTTTYVEPIIIGIHGEQGPQGPQGIQGPKGATGSQGPRGNVGVGVTSITEHYLATSASSGVTTSTTGWTTTIQTMDATKKYLWNYEKINFSDGTNQPTIPVIIGVYGDKGATGSTGPTGATGRSITGITEHYLVSSSATGVTRTTSGWTTTMQTTTPEKRYLWNYETITWSSGTSPTYVEPIVIGIHGEQGPQGIQGPKGATGSQGPRGNVGVGVTSITENYLATSASSGVTTATAGWSTTMQTIDATKKYLWNYEIINFSDGTNQPTIPVIIGVYGDKGATGSTGPTGRSIVSIVERYLATSASSGVTRSTSGWTTTMQTTTPEKKYLWNYETITWSSGTITTYVEPIIIGIHGAQGPQGTQGPQGIQGPQGPNGTSQYIHIRYSTASNGNPMTTTPSASTMYIGIANTTSSTAPTGYASYTWSLFKGEKGDQGIQGPKGPNGQATYTWIKYADTDAGGGMSDSPSGKKYIGMAFNKTTATESTTASQYTWSLMPQNIEVGAKNLLLKSNEEITNSSYPIATYQMSEKMVVGQEYTIRLWGTLGTGKTNFTPYLNGGSISLGALKNNGDGTFSLTFVGKDSGVTTGDTIHIYPFASTTVVDSTITKIKLEKGSVATDWTEAPEDVEARISDKASNESVNEVASGLEEIRGDLVENYAGVGDIQRLDEAMIASNAAIEEARADSIKDIEGINNRTAILEQNFGDYAVDWNFIRTSVRLADEGVRISKAGEKTGVLIQNNKISFVSEGHDVAYITGSELYITQGTFLNNVKIGNHRVSTLESDNTITVIRYEG